MDSVGGIYLLIIGILVAVLFFLIFALWGHITIISFRGEPIIFLWPSSSGLYCQNHRDLYSGKLWDRLFLGQTGMGD